MDVINMSFGEFETDPSRSPVDEAVTVQPPQASYPSLRPGTRSTSSGAARSALRRRLRAIAAPR
jgi:hypothetical protein